MKIDFTKEENILNLLTLRRTVMIPLFVLILCLRKNSTGHVVTAIAFVLASTTDYLDDYLARKWQVATNLGKFADPLADKMLAMTVLIMLVELKMIPTWIAAIIICRKLAVIRLRLLLAEGGGTVLAVVMPREIKAFTQMLSIILLLCHFLIIGTFLFCVALISTTYSGYDYFKGVGLLFKDTFKRH